MIKISCSKLEQVRNNPQLYGQMLAIGEGKAGKGQHGMFAYMKDTIREVHLGDITVAQGIKEMHNRFLRFDETAKNKTKQDDLVKHYLIYHKLFEKRKWEFACGTKNINWLMHEKVVLTGHTPWVFKKNEEYIAYYITESALEGWKHELRFPLIQEYLANNILKCDPANIKVGNYALTTAKFDLECFSISLIDNAISTTKKVFEKVLNAYEGNK